MLKQLATEVDAADGSTRLKNGTEPGQHLPTMPDPSHDLPTRSDLPTMPDPADDPERSQRFPTEPDPTKKPPPIDDPPIHDPLPGSEEDRNGDVEPFVA
jgi:hypothetical protein